MLFYRIIKDIRLDLFFIYLQEKISIINVALRSNLHFHLMANLNLGVVWNSC